MIKVGVLANILLDKEGKKKKKKGKPKKCLKKYWMFTILFF
jgi:hypothetical protein